MSKPAKVREFFRVIGEAASVLPALNYRIAADDEKVSLGSVFEDSVSRYPDNTMLIFEGRQWTYTEFNSEVNRFARVMTSKGVNRGDTVALLMENRAEYALAMLAAVKLGASCSLINNGLSGAGLVHCIKATDAIACIVGEERTEVLDEVRGELGLEEGAGYFWFADNKQSPKPDWALDAKTEMEGMFAHNLEVTREVTAGENALYIFTSGTTGLPKAAVVLHRKILAASQGMGRIGFKLKPKDRLYLCLPIYHITGMGPGFCGFICSGGSIVLRRSFSASKFWPEVREHKANCFIYVGELCRYLSMRSTCAGRVANTTSCWTGISIRKLSLATRVTSDPSPAIP